MKKIIVIILFTVLCLQLPSPVLADYVLPYPSYMPGSTLYKITRILDTLKKYWYFGNIAQVKYRLGLADKYVVEAKTLFEYNQYLLGADALSRSDLEFSLIPKYIAGTGLAKTVEDAATKHVQVLTDLRVPQQYTWTPEKAAATDLQLGRMIQSSIDLRIRVATAAAAL